MGTLLAVIMKKGGSPPRGPRKPYRTPSLVAYGDIHEITHTSDPNAMRKDGLTGLKTE